jgi:YggT family protein
MLVARNFLQALASVLDIGLSAYYWLIIIYTIISWVRPNPYHPLVRFLRTMCEPILRPIRRIIPTSQWGIDFSPFIAIILLIFLRRFLIPSFYQMSYYFR